MVTKNWITGCVMRTIQFPRLFNCEGKVGSTVREKLAHRLRDAHETISEIGYLISVVIGSQVSLFVMVFAIIILFLTDSGLL
jgi:hypothetical protein